MNTPHKTLDHWRLWQEAQGLSERTISERANVMRHLFAHTGAKPLKVKPEHIIAFMARPGLSETSRATYHATIRAYCLWLVRTRQRKSDPSLSTPTPKRKRGTPRPIPTGNLATLLGVVTRRRTKMMVLLAACAGLRVHEIAKFHGEDLDLLNGIITVTGKGGSTEMIPAHEAIVALASEFPRHAYWFSSYELHRSKLPHLGRAAVYQAIADAMKRAGVIGTPHQLRHWYGTSLLAEGVNLRIVQKLMRHKSVATTQIYTDVTWAQLRAGMDMLTLPDAA